MASPRLVGDSEMVMEQLLKSQKQLVMEMQGLRRDMRDMTLDPAEEEELIVQDLDSMETAASQEPKLVQMSTNIRRVYDVKTKEQEFTVRLAVDFRWEMSAGENPPPESQDDGDWIPEWTPKFEVRDMKSEDRSELYTTQNIGGKVYVHAQTLCLLVLSEAFELHKFPNDCQDLTISLQSHTPAAQCKWISPLDGSQPVQIRKVGMCLDDFELLPDYPYTYNLFMSEHSGRVFSALEIKLKATRQARFYIINVALIMFLICSFVLCAWAVHPGAIADRWGVDFTLVLTAVAFKLILNDMLPRLSYLTTLDIYVLFGFVFLALATFSHSVLPLCFHTKMDYSALTLPPLSVEEEEQVIDADLISFYVFAFGWLFWNLGYTAYFFASRNNEISSFRTNAKQEAEQIDSADDELIREKQNKLIATAQDPKAQ